MKTGRFLIIAMALVLAGGAAFGQSAANYINNVPDLNQPPANPLNIAGFDTSNYCAPFAAANITEYWHNQGASGPADHVDGNPNPGGTSVAQYIGWWMNTNDDPNMNGCPYRMNGDPTQVSKKGTILTDIPPGIVQFAQWDANNTFGCTPPPNPMAGKAGYSWTIGKNQNAQIAWVQIKSEIDNGRPLIVVWNYWNPTNQHYNSEDGYTYYKWGAKADGSQGEEDPDEEWNSTQELGHAVTAVGYVQDYDPYGEDNTRDWVIVHDNWSTTATDVAILFAHQDGQTPVWMANVTVDPYTAPPRPTLTASAGQNDGGNHQCCIGMVDPMCQINFAADNVENILINALTLVASGTGNDQNDITKIEIVKDVNHDGLARARDGDKILATHNGGFPQDNGTLTMIIPGNWIGTVAKNGGIDLIVAYHLGFPAEGVTFQVQVSAVYATGCDSYIAAAVNGIPFNSGTATTQQCVIGLPYPPITTPELAKVHPDGQGLVVTVVDPINGPGVTGSGSNFGNTLYIQHPKPGSKGVMLDFTPLPTPSVSLGQRFVHIEGRLATIDGQRALVSAQVMTGPPGPPIDPVAMSNKAVGGADWFYDCITGSGQMGVAGGVGLNNIGTLVRVFGLVMPDTSTTFYVTDGSGAPLKVKIPSGPPPPAPNSYVSVTGVCSTEMLGGELRPIIKTRTSGDVVKLRQ